MNSSHQQPQATTHLETVSFYLQKNSNLMKSKFSIVMPRVKLIHKSFKELSFQHSSPRQQHPLAPLYCRAATAHSHSLLSLPQQKTISVNHKQRLTPSISFRIVSDCMAASLAACVCLLVSVHIVSVCLCLSACV